MSSLSAVGETILVELVRAEGKPLGIQIRTSRYDPPNPWASVLTAHCMYVPFLIVDDVIITSPIDIASFMQGFHIERGGGGYMYILGIPFDFFKILMSY